MEDIGTQHRDFNWKMDKTRQSILVAILPEIMFDGWTQSAFDTALKYAKIDEAHAKLAFPRGAIDVAIYMHKDGDRQMAEQLPERTQSIKSFSAKIEAAINLRLEIANPHKEAVRRASSLFALPQNSVTGSQLIWGTADAIWTSLGDTSKGFSYYSKRSTLSAVYSSSLLYWLQDSSEEMQETREFVARRIKDVGNFGKFTSKFKRKSA